MLLRALQIAMIVSLFMVTPAYSKDDEVCSSVDHPAALKVLRAAAEKHLKTLGHGSVEEERQELVENCGEFFIVTYKYRPGVLERIPYIFIDFDLNLLWHMFF